MVNRYGCRKEPIILGLAVAVLSVPVLAFAMSLSPGAILQGESGVLAISTPGTHWSAGVTVGVGDGIVTERVQVSNPELLFADIQVEAGAVLGPRNVVVQQDGNYVIGADAFTVLSSAGNRNVPGHATLLDVNVMTNPGFETGDMTGWIPVTWSISTVIPHSGSYDAYDPGGSGGGGQCIRQEFNPPIDSNTITDFSFWLRQPDDLGIAQVALWYQSSPTQYGVIFTNDDDSWTFGDFTNMVVPNDFVTAIHVCGFGGGYETPDDSWSDDYQLLTSEPSPVEQASWGRIKGIYR